MTRSANTPTTDASANGGSGSGLAVRIEGLSTSFDGRLVLHDVSLKVQRRKIVFERVLYIPPLIEDLIRSADPVRGNQAGVQLQNFFIF